MCTENKEAFDEQQFSSALEQVVKLLSLCSVADATNWRWEDEEVPDFNDVFEKLGKLAVTQEDKVRLHCNAARVCVFP